MLQHLLTQIFLDGERSPTETQDSFKISVFARRVNGVCKRSRQEMVKRETHYTDLDKKVHMDAERKYEESAGYFKR